MAERRIYGDVIMKIGMTSLTFRNAEIPDVFKYAKEAGIQGIEWGVCEKHIKLCDDESIELVKKLSKEYGIEILSLGSYCNMTDFDECIKVLQTAQMLNAPIIRIWAGNKESDECSEEEYNLIVKNTKRLSEMSEKLLIALCFEYHPYTLTHNATSAIKLIKDIDKTNVGLYWQPKWNLTYDENKAEFEMVKPYVIKNIHISNYNEDTGYEYLSDIYENLCGYFKQYNDYNIFIEFVKDASPKSLMADADVLRRAFD